VSRRCKARGSKVRPGANKISSPRGKGPAREEGEEGKRERKSQMKRGTAGNEGGQEKKGRKTMVDKREDVWGSKSCHKDGWTKKVCA